MTNDNIDDGKPQTYYETGTDEKGISCGRLFIGGLNDHGELVRVIIMEGYDLDLMQRCRLVLDADIIAFTTNIKPPKYEM